MMCLVGCLLGCKQRGLDADAVSIAALAIKQAQLDARIAAIEPNPVVEEEGQGTELRQLPPDYVRVGIRAASGPDFGDAVVMIDEKGARLVPIYIGGTEALSIRLRLEERRFQRPLTHDLLDSMLEQVGAKLVRVQVDDLDGDVFIGTVILEKDGRLIALDSRPSDAIALALGNGAPIFASRRLLDRAGLEIDELPGSAPSRHEPIAL